MYEEPERMKLLYSSTPCGLEKEYNAFVEKLDRAYTHSMIIEVQYRTHRESTAYFTAMVRYQTGQPRRLPA